MYKNFFVLMSIVFICLQHKFLNYCSHLSPYIHTQQSITWQEGQFLLCHFYLTCVCTEISIFLRSVCCCFCCCYFGHSQFLALFSVILYLTECYWQPFLFLFAHFIIRFRVVLNVQWHYVRFELVIGLSGQAQLSIKSFLVSYGIFLVSLMSGFDFCDLFEVMVCGNRYFWG